MMTSSADPRELNVEAGTFSCENGAAAVAPVSGKRRAMIYAVTSAVGVAVGVSLCLLGTTQIGNDAVIRSEYDLGCVTNHLGARGAALGKVADCRLTKAGIAQGFDQVFGKFAYARPVPLVRPSGSEIIPMRARTGNVMMALSADEAGEARKFFIGGNWKATGTPDSVKSLVEALNAGKVEVDTEKSVDVVCSPPFVYLSQVKDTLRSDFSVAAQNLWNQAPGAWTGETPAEMLTGMGVGWVILGHSERRDNCGETDQVVADKTKFAVDAGLSTITCIGEKLDAREGGTTFDVLNEQMKPLAATLDEKDWDKVVLAYEPVWAIGTGKVATPEQAEDTHAYLRKWLTDNVSEKVSNSVRILYGGSVKPDNADELSVKPNIDGFLVGGASLDGPGFTSIINSGKNQ